MNLKTCNLQMSDGSSRQFLFPDTPLGIAAASEVLECRAYWLPDFKIEPRMIVDVGANIGAFTLLMHNRFPKATIHSYEPSSVAFEILARNTNSVPNIVCHRYGLSNANMPGRLFRGKKDTVESSLYRTEATTALDAEFVDLLDASDELTSLGSVDVIKIDTEGHEVPILSRCRYSSLPRIGIVFVEYHSERDRRLIDQLMTETHVLWNCHAVQPHRGVVCYVRTDVVPVENNSIEIVREGA